VSASRKKDDESAIGERGIETPFGAAAATLGTANDADNDRATPNIAPIKKREEHMIFDASYGRRRVRLELFLRIMTVPLHACSF
jgi:hypothetical protein